MPRSGRRSTSPTPTLSQPAAAFVPDEQALPMSPRLRYATAGAVALGGLLWIIAGNDMSWRRWKVVLAAVCISLIPPVTRFLATLLGRLRRPSPRTAEWTGLIVGVVAVVYLIGTALLQERALAPRMLDESSYAIGAQILARGRLWLPPHPLADFFDSFFVVTRPVYSSIYFPGTALAFAPAVWFGWATWILPVVLSGIIVGLLYRIVTELTGDGAAGLLAALWIVSLMAFRALSVMVMSQIVMLFLGMLILWAWLRWREQRRWTWALAIGALCGWAAITRPVDALAYAIPVGVAIAMALRARPAREWATAALLLTLGAAPFLSLQVAHNVGVTGRPLQTPYTDYLQREQPGAQYGVRKYDPAWQPASDAWQVKAYYNWCRPYLEHHQPHNFLRPWFAAQEMTVGRIQPANFLTLADNTLPARPLLLVLPAGVIALMGDRRRWVLAATLPLFVLLYMLNPFFLPHYVVVIAPAMILLTLLGVDAVAGTARGRLADVVRVGTTTAVLAIAATSLWEVKWLLSPEGRPLADGFQEEATKSLVRDSIDLVAKPPAVVLFGTPPDQWTEMVYNVDAATPDDAPIIRARDLGPRNAEIIDYYGQRQPDRTFYQFDWRRGSLKRLGEAGVLREQLVKGTPIEALMNRQ
jgi:hypothetical protein